MADKRKNIIKPEDFIINYSPGKKAFLSYSYIKKSFITAVSEPLRNLLKHFFLLYTGNPNDLEVDRINGILDRRKGIRRIDKISSYLAEKFFDDHLRKFEYSFLAECLPKIGLENKTIADMGGGFSYSTIVPMFLAGKNTRIISLDYIDFPRKSKYRVEYRTADCMNTQLNDSSVDIVTMISTLEHVGLGRYGDPLNPQGDMKAMQEARRILKKGGYLILTIPYGYPTVVYNLHRVYDKGRFEMITIGFKPVILEYTLLGKKSRQEDVEGKHVSKNIKGYYQEVPEKQKIWNAQGGILALLVKK